MDDNEIVDLYWQRSELAIGETADKYGAYCMKISMNILSDASDSEENVNDTYMQAWRSMPPQRPKCFSAFLGKLARNLALNRYKARHTQKRFPGEFLQSLDELSLCAPSRVTPEDEAAVAALGKSISDFLRTEKESAREVFIRRYFYCDSLEDISGRLGYSQSKLKSMLMRTRSRLRLHLEKEGYYEE